MGRRSLTTVKFDGLLVDSGNIGGTVLSGGGHEVVSSGGLASRTVVSGGGTEDVVVGIARNTMVTRGGFQTMSSGGTAGGTVVRSGGLQTLFSGGVAGTTVVSSGGNETVSSGRLAKNSLVANGGTAVDLGALVFTNVGPWAFAGILSDGGSVTAAGTRTLVLRGNAGAFSGTETIGHGTLELTSGGAAGKGTIVFAGSGTKLKIDGTVMPTNVISGFSTGEVINLAGIPFTSGDTATYSDTTLTIKNSGGTALAKLTIAGSHTISSFTLSTDPTSGMDIRDPPATTTAASAGSDTVPAAIGSIGSLPQLASSEHLDAAVSNSTLQGGLVVPLPSERVDNDSIGIWVDLPGVPGAALDFDLATSRDIALDNTMLHGSSTASAATFVHMPTLGV